MALGIVLTALLETKMLIGTYSGSFTIVIKENDAWNFKYVWLNLNSISMEDALNIIGRYKNILYDAMTSSTPTSIYRKEKWIHIMFSEPPHSINSLVESVVRIIGLNITSLNPANAVLSIEIINPEGGINSYELNGSISKNTLPKYFYAKVLKSGIYTFRIINNSNSPVTLTINIGEGIIISRRPLIYYGIVVIILSVFTIYHLHIFKKEFKLI